MSTSFQHTLQHSMQLQNHLHFHMPSRSDSQSLASDTVSVTSSTRRLILARSPIVGKVEFDIDLNKGKWYDKWSARKRSQPPPMLLSRRNTAKRLSQASELGVPGLQASVSVYSDQGVDTSDITLHPVRRIATGDESFASPGGYAALDDGSGSEYDGGDPGEFGNDEEEWRKLRTQSKRRRARAKGEFDVDLEGEISEEDPIGGHGGEDVDEVLAMWKDSKLSKSAGLSSPIILRAQRDVVGSPGSVDTDVGRADIRSAKPTRPLPPPLHLRSPSDALNSPSVQVVQASPFPSPAGYSFPLSPVDGSEPPTPDHMRSSNSLDVIGNRNSTYSALSIGSSSSLGEDGDESDYRVQLKLRKRLDSLERVRTFSSSVERYLSCIILRS